MRRFGARRSGGEERSDSSRAAWALLALAGFAFALTCARPPAPRPRAITHVPPAPVPVSPVLPGPTPEPAQRIERDERPASEVEVGPLARFRLALRELAAGARDRVRVVWLGDSHTAADYWTHPVRRRLCDVAESGGPGFVHVGIPNYQHSMVRVDATGRWRAEPRAPSARELQADGNFGPSGMRARASGGARAVLRVVDPPAVRVSWTVGLRFPDAGARVSLSLGDAAVVLGRIEPAALSQIHWETLRGEAAAPLTVVVERGEVELFGAIAEFEQPGVVLDTLGINGARAATPLAWDEQAWMEHLARREPQLVVLAYGTNEVFDALKPHRYESHYSELLRRVRAAAPDADCLMIGPTDVARGGAERDSRAAAIDGVQQSTAASVGCAYFSAFQAMGGGLGFEAWRATEPQLASPDGVHLTRTGYSLLGERVADFLLERTTLEVPESPP